MRLALVPKEVIVTFNGERLASRDPVHVFVATLDTEIADGDGCLRKSRRQTEVRVFAPHDGETAMLYEMGLPVVETGDKWDVDVRQKVPLTLDCANVPESFLRAIRTYVLNGMHESLEEDEVNQDWVRQATSDPRCSDAATIRAMDLRFGEKRVSFDPFGPGGQQPCCR